MTGVWVLIIEGGRTEQGYSSDGATFHVKHRSVTACLCREWRLSVFAFVCVAFIGIAPHAFADNIVSRETPLCAAY